MTTMQSTDASLITRAKEGDGMAFGELVARYIQPCYRLAYRILRNADDAEDAVQESFVAALLALDTFDVARPFARWINRIVARKCLTAIDRQRIRAAEQLTEETPSNERGPDDHAIERQQEERIRAAMTALPKRQREIVQLIELDGWSAVQAANQLGISHATARWHLHEARNALRVILRPLFC